MEVIQINKKIFWRFVNKKVKNIVNHYHILGVINILFEEMAQDLKDGKEIKIYNFCTLQLKKMPGRRFHHITLKKLVFAEGRKHIKIKMPKKIKLKITRLLDLNKTFSDENNE
jgi:nucleoid DNA-binding protein